MDEHDVVVQTLIRERDELKNHCLRLQGMLENVGYPPGHFYSPVVDIDDIHAISESRDRLLAPLPAGIDIDAGRILEMMRRLASYHSHFPFPRNKTEPFRFYFGNAFFGVHDASILFSILLAFRPRRVIEVGCGYSSCLLLDTNEMFFDNKIDLTMVDPSLEELRPLFGPKGTGAARLFPNRLQDVPPGIFEELERNDILFIDSSHVAKTGSDVNYYLFRILPFLKPGVLVHVHDVLYPFEYPEAWVREEKRSWNEAYILHAFLQYNSSFGILYWANFVYHRFQDELRALMPACMENEGGSLWLRRTG
jgi:hypothetical protein